METKVQRFLHDVGIDVDEDTAWRYFGVLEQMRQKKEKHDAPLLYKERSPAPSDGLTVLVPKVPITSFCKHHLLPWVGWVSITYKPGAWILGVSKFKRLVDWLSIGLTVQEEVTKNVHTLLVTALEVPVTVEIRAMHTCAVARGVRLEPDFEFVTRMEGNG